MYEYEGFEDLKIWRGEKVERDWRKRRGVVMFSTISRIALWAVYWINWIHWINGILDYWITGLLDCTSRLMLTTPDVYALPDWMIW
jgi:hypothetical protein